MTARSASTPGQAGIVRNAVEVVDKEIVRLSDDMLWAIGALAQPPRNERARRRREYVDNIERAPAH